MAELSVLIPARNERWVNRTVADVLSNIRGDTEVIVVLDGQWPEEPLAQDARVTVLHVPSALGQRGAVNVAARASTAKWVMKLDAHCGVAEGFDVELMRASQPTMTQIPAQYNLHVFDWVCRACKHRTYQGPCPSACAKCRASAEAHTIDVVWQRRKNRKTEFWRFGRDLKFAYWGAYGHRDAARGEIVDVMTSLGACFFLERERFWALGGLDEQHGGWGQLGVEVACKSWLSGGRHVVNRRTWFSHLFRTQPGYGFPYPLSGAEQERARKYSRDLWLNDAWPGAVRPLSWLVDKFAPVPEW